MLLVVAKCMVGKDLLHDRAMHVNPGLDRTLQGKNPVMVEEGPQHGAEEVPGIKEILEGI